MPPRWGPEEGAKGGRRRCEQGTCELALEGGGKEIPGEGTVFAEPGKHEGVGQGVYRGRRGKVGIRFNPHPRAVPTLFRLPLSPNPDFPGRLTHFCLGEQIPAIMTASCPVSSLLPLESTLLQAPGICWTPDKAWEVSPAVPWVGDITCAPERPEKVQCPIPALHQYPSLLIVGFSLLGASLVSCGGGLSLLWGQTSLGLKSLSLSERERFV